MTVPKTAVLVLDSAEPELLAQFYAELLGASAGPAPGDGELLLITGGTGVVLGVRRDPDHIPPSWPLPEGSQQAHVCILVEQRSLDEAEREAVALGARPVAAEDDGSLPGRRHRSDEPRAGRPRLAHGLPSGGQGLWQAPAPMPATARGRMGLPGLASA
ncbi:VOC family protein [Streptomyces nojiriensis]|uniref:VOC family protein n=1 Tax=Streptomyces nojiriensis TaxID=66374 RepID=UPI0036DB1E8E